MAEMEVGRFMNAFYRLSYNVFQLIFFSHFCSNLPIGVDALLITSKRDQESFLIFVLDFRVAPRRNLLANRLICCRSVSVLFHHACVSFVLIYSFFFNIIGLIRVIFLTGEVGWRSVGGNQEPG